MVNDNNAMQVSAATTASNLSACELGAWRGFLRVHSLLVKELDAELEAEHGLGLSSYEVLVNLAAAPHGRLRMSTLAESVLLSRSGLTRLVDRLGRSGLIERFGCPADARGAYASITDAGLSKLAQARATHLRGIRERFVERFSEEELAQLESFWARILEVVGDATPVSAS